MSSDLMPPLLALVWPGTTIIVVTTGVAFSGLILVLGRLWERWRRPRSPFAAPHAVSSLTPRNGSSGRDRRRAESIPDLKSSDIAAQVETNWR
jgi:hypothetical protein